MKGPWIVARQIAFFGGEAGKWHAAWRVSGQAVCNSALLVDISGPVIRTSQGQESDKVHPIVCRRCLRLSTLPGVTAEGMIR